MDTVWTQWRDWEVLVNFKGYLDTSPLFAFYERPFITTLWRLWPIWPIVLTVIFIHFAFTVAGTANKVERYGVGSRPLGAPGLIWAYVGLAGYLLLGTLSGSQYASLMETWRANPAIVPQKLPPRPPPPTGTNNLYDKRYAVSGPRVQKLSEMRNTANMLRTSLDFFILLSPVFLICVCVIGTQARFYVFARSYARAQARTHLPTEIVNQALEGKRVDHRALAAAMTVSTTPVQPDSLADKVEREKLASLAARLEADTRALDEKYSKEAEIARLVVSHARKREELADMEQRLKDLGVQKHG